MKEGCNKWAGRFLVAGLLMGLVAGAVIEGGRLWESVREELVRAELDLGRYGTSILSRTM